MIFENIDFSLDNNKLLDVIEKNCLIARNARSEIRTAERLLYQSRSEYSVLENAVPVSELEDISTEDSEFEDAVSCYLDDYLNLDLEFNEADLIDILPSKNAVRYNDLLMRLIAESIKDIKEYKELSLDSEISKEELIEIKNFILCEEKKISIIKKLLAKKDIKESNTGDIEEEKNTLVLVPTIGGRIRTLSEIEDMPVEYLPMFKDLFDSIIDGSFKNIKKFDRNSDLAGFLEVRKPGVRVVFKRISRRKYAIITAFIKRKTNDSGYRETLINKINDFNKVQGSDILENSEFIKNNDLNVQELYRLLGCTEKNPEYIKGGN